MAAISDLIILVWQNITSILLLCTLLHLIRNYLTPGLSAIPGPFLAKLTNIWRFVDVSKGQAQVTQLKLHRQYGDYVRLGPNVVSIRDLDAIKTIYGINKGYEKVNHFHILLGYVAEQKLNVFVDQLLQSSAAISQGQADANAFHNYQ